MSTISGVPKKRTDSMSTLICQLSDLHLFADPDGQLAGVPTWHTFRRVLEQVNHQHDDFDYLILTGDLAQDEDSKTYAMLREALGGWLERCRIIPGNHDNPERIRKTFPELFSDEQDNLTFTLDTGGWRIIGLDSHVPGDVKGHVGRNQLEWLKTQLDTEPSLPTLLFVHHPPIAINVAWLDQIAFYDASALTALIENSPQIEVVCSGHVHREFAGRIGRTQVYTTPSTCVQFAARAEKAFDTKAAGYRTFKLDHDGYHTEVHRLAD